MTYTIEVEYQTGDSFSSEVCTETIGHVWEDKTLARKALQCLKEHYELFIEHEEHNRPRRHMRSYLDVRIDAKSREWHNGDKDMYRCCDVEMDDGSKRTLPTCMWCGYFEKLHHAKIVCEQDDEDYVSF